MIDDEAVKRFDEDLLLTLIRKKKELSKLHNHETEKIRSTVIEPEDHQPHSIETKSNVQSEKNGDQPLINKSKYSTNTIHQSLSDSDRLKVLDFTQIKLGKTQTLELRVENPKGYACVFELFTTLPFFIPTKKIIVKANSFLNLPIAYRPSRIGDSQSFLVLKFGNETLKVKCFGRCYK